MTQSVGACLGLLHKSLDLAGLVHDYDTVLGGVLHLGHQNGALCPGLLVEGQHLLQREVADDVTAQAQAPVRPSSNEDILSIARIAIAGNGEDLCCTLPVTLKPRMDIWHHSVVTLRRIDLASLCCAVTCTAYKWLALIPCRWLLMPELVGLATIDSFSSCCNACKE